VSVALVSIGTYDPNCWYFPSHSFQTGCCRGSAKSAIGVDPTALVMNRFQMSAGKLPPETVRPWTLVIWMAAFG
jgi:hypothetical protein